MHANFLKPVSTGIFVLLLTVACQRNGNQATSQTVTIQQNNPPAWLKQKIAVFLADKPANPPVKIYRYTYQDQEVYYITGRSGDIPSEVYTVQGEQLCQPDGGITGRGDGRCPDFFETRTNEKLIWEDTRK